MRTLLVNPWIYDFAAYDLWSKPLGILTIAAHLKKAGCEISLIDCLDRFDPGLSKYIGKKPRTTASGCGTYYSEEIEKPAIFGNIPRKYKRYGFPLNYFLQRLKKEKRPDIILVTTGMTYWYPSYIETVKYLKNRFPGTPVMLGGIYASLCHMHAAGNTGADLVYKGSDIAGILSGVNKLSGKEFDRSYDISKPLFPYYDMYPSLPYVTLRTSRGCPFKCTYCGWHLLDKAYSRLNPADVASEIVYLNKKCKVENFAFYDDALLYRADDHLVPMLERIISANINANFHTPNGLHNRFITPRIASLFRKAGFVKPRLALETSSQKRQRLTGSKTTNDEFAAAVSCLNKAGYGPGEIGAYLLIGLPGQNVNEAEDTVRFASKFKVRIFLEEYSPIPGTPEYGKCGLPYDADPLWHNNSIFALYDSKIRPKFQDLKDRVRAINTSY